jgi:hypothetical protein
MMPEITVGSIFNCNVRNDVFLVTKIKVRPPIFKGDDEDYVEYDLTSLKSGYVSNATAHIIKWNFENGNWSL